MAEALSCSLNRSLDLKSSRLKDSWLLSPEFVPTTEVSTFVANVSCLGELSQLGFESEAVTETEFGDADIDDVVEQDDYEVVSIAFAPDLRGPAGFGVVPTGFGVVFELPPEGYELPTDMCNAFVDRFPGTGYEDWDAIAFEYFHGNGAPQKAYKLPDRMIKAFIGEASFTTTTVLGSTPINSFAGEILDAVTESASTPQSQACFRFGARRSLRASLARVGQSLRGWNSRRNLQRQAEAGTQSLGSSESFDPDNFWDSCCSHCGMYGL